LSTPRFSSGKRNANKCSREKAEGTRALRQPNPSKQYANRDGEQHAVFDNPKPAGLRMQGDIFFLPVEFLEGYVLYGKATSGTEH
jgi:hypothetical protein